jgi:hypothetical protein
LGRGLAGQLWSADLPGQLWSYQSGRATLI